MYREYGRLVYAVAHRALGRHDLAEEAVQQTFMNVWRAGRPDRCRSRPGAVAGDDREARRHRHLSARGVAAHDGARRRRRQRPRARDPAARSRDARHGVAGAARDRRALSRRSGDRSIQHLDGMTQKEISEKLGIALGTVKSRSHRADRHLAALLGHLATA